MSEIIAFPLPVGPNYTIPDVGDENWGQNVTNFLVAIPHGVVPTAGTFTLTGALTFAAFGLVLENITSQTSDPASSGFLRLAKTDVLSWRNNANSADLPLGINGSDQLTFNGFTITPGNGVVNVGTQYQLAYYAASTNAVSGNPNTMAANEVVVNDANGVPTTTGNGGTTATEIGYVHGVTSSIQTQINAIVGAGVYGPIGSSFLYSSATPPNSNYMLKNGAAISRTTYATLFALIGTTFGSGDGSTTFNIPNATDTMPITAGNLYTLGQTGGATTHTLTATELPTSIPVTDPGHNHTQNAHTHTDSGHSHALANDIWNRTSGATSITVSAGTFQDSPSGGLTSASGTANISTVTATNNGNTTGITVGGSGGAHSILNPFLAEYWMYRVI